MRKSSPFDKISFQFHEYFYYTRTERNASIVLVVLCVVFFALPSFYPILMPPDPPMDFSAFKAAIEQSGIGQHLADTGPDEEYPEFRGMANERPVAELFQFDPNTASKEDFVRLGLSPRTAQTVINYRSKGGRFFKKEDLKKLYGLREEDYDRLVDWVVIHDARKDMSGDKKTTKGEDVAFFSETGEGERSGFPKEMSKFPKKETAPVAVDINTATAEDWQQLRGIGPAYSKYIVNFRDKLGGFVSVDQVGDTRGIPDSVFQKIKPFLSASPITKKLVVNQCTLDELKAHPYINSLQATLIFNYRKQHGNFNNMDDLKKIREGFKEEDWNRLVPYLAF